MNWEERISRFLSPGMKPLRRALRWPYRKWTRRPRSRQQLHQYWKTPWDGANLPEGYLKDCEARSLFLLDIIRKRVERDARILEIGCNVGRNLSYLFSSGFTNLHGIELSSNAVRLLERTFPEMARQTRILNAPIEEVIGDLDDENFDVVFTMAVLEHIHPSSEWVFSEIVRVTRGTLLTIEDERAHSWRHFPRNYKKVFEPLGMTQIEAIGCSEIDGLGGDFVARTFTRPSHRREAKGTA